MNMRKYPCVVYLCCFRYCILGDGCQMEGIANEACSLAGHWGLGKLIAFYDDNHISIDGDTEIAFTESVEKRFEALGWHIVWVKNGNNGYDDIRAAIKEAKAVTDKPTLIKVSNFVTLSHVCLFVTQDMTEQNRWYCVWLNGHGRGGHSRLLHK